MSATTSSSAASTLALVSHVTSQPDGLGERSPVVSGNVAHLLFRSCLETPDRAAPRPRSPRTAGVGPAIINGRIALNSCVTTATAAFPLERCDDRVVHRPRSTRASVAQPHDRRLRRRRRDAASSTRCARPRRRCGCPTPTVADGASSTSRSHSSATHFELRQVRSERTPTVRPTNAATSDPGWRSMSGREPSDRGS